MPGRGKQSSAAAVFAGECYNNLGQMLQRFLYNFNMVWLIWKSVTHRLEATSQLGWGAPGRRFTAALWVTPPWCSLQGKLSACLLKVSAKLGSEVLGNTYM